MKWRSIISISILIIIFSVVSALCGLYLYGALAKNLTELKIAEGERIIAEGKREIDFATADVIRWEQEEKAREAQHDRLMQLLFIFSLWVLAGLSWFVSACLFLRLEQKSRRQEERIAAQYKQHADDIKEVTKWGRKWVDIAFDKIAEVRREK